MKIPCILIDCDAETCLALQKFSNNIPVLSITQEYQTIREAIIKIDPADQIGLLVIDIDKLGSKGPSQVAELGKKVTSIVLISAKIELPDEYLNSGITDFISKPLNLSRFKEVIYRSEAYGLELDKNRQAELDFFFVKLINSKKLERINLNAVIAFEVNGAVLIIHLQAGVVKTHMRLINIVELLKDNVNFVRIHRSYIVSKNHIVVIEDPFVQMSKSSLRLSVSDTYHYVFQQMTNSWTVQGILKKRKDES